MRPRRRKALVAFIRQLPVCRIAFTDVAIPLMEIGKGKPIVSVIAGIHGNETSGLLVLDELLQQLPGFVKGKLRIIFSANPAASFENKRISHIDSLDMNRVFPGNPSRTVSEKLATAVLDAIKDSDAVIDLHSFEMETPLMGIITESKDRQLKKRNLALIKAFSPEQVWEIRHGKKSGKQFKGSLGAALNHLKIPNIAVESNRPETITNSEIKRCVEGIKRVLKLLGILNSATACRGKFKLLDRTVMRSSESGIFIPAIKALEKVKKGSVIGRIRKLPECEETIVKASCSGIVMQLLRKSFIIPGQEIAAIGHGAKK